MSPSSRPYYSSKGSSAVHYDTVTAADERLTGDIDIYAGLVSGPCNVLELGVGTGRVAMGLVRRGHSVLGLDIAPSMLDQAQAKRNALSADLAASLRLKLGDMTCLALDETFDLILCPYFTLAHVPPGAAWRNTFQGVARHLRSGGQAAFHLPTEEGVRLAQPPSDRAAFVRPLKNGGQLALYVIDHKFNPKFGRMDLVLDYVTTASPGAARSHSRERLTNYVADPMPYAEAAGLKMETPPISFGEIGAIHVFRKP
jgi:SAM-dependent methyltransferase